MPYVVGFLEVSASTRRSQACRSYGWSCPAYGLAPLSTRHVLFLVAPKLVDNPVSSGNLMASQDQLPYLIPPHTALITLYAFISKFTVRRITALVAIS
ncbi:hypothetical protein D3C85_1666290 [compost metagenome]